MRRRIGLIAFIVAVFGLGRASAQTTIPDGVFVRDSADNTWLVTGGTRAAVPIYEAEDEDILAIPANGRWVTPMSVGLLVLGDRPEWASEPEPVRLKDDPPKVTIRLAADEIDHGATVEVTISASDDIGVDWIEWETEIARNGEATDDPALTTIRRFECENKTECSNTWSIPTTGQGRYVILARARDTTGQRSDADADLTIR
jgi:hypothetical protein